MGLNNEEVIESRHKYGSNTLQKEKRNTLLALFIESLGDPIIKILLIALGIKIIVLYKDFDWFETIGMVLAILIASLVSSISEYGSEKAFDRLQNESSTTRHKVKRNNHIEEIITDDIVKNDIVLLSAGDKIPADGHLISGEVSVDESALNGESKEIIKSAKDYGDKKKVYRGSVVYANEAIMQVDEVGEKTIFGSLAKELQIKEPDSPLKIRLRGLAKVISRWGYFGAILVSISYLFSVLVINNNFDINLIMNDLTNYRLLISYLLYALTLSVTIIVVAVPEDCYWI